MIMVDKEKEKLLERVQRQRKILDKAKEIKKPE